MRPLLLSRRTKLGAAGSVDFVRTVTPGGATNAFTGEVGFKFTVGASDIVVTDLGRWIFAGSSSSTHLLHLATAADSLDVPGGSVTVDASGAPTDTWLFGALAAPVTLTAGLSYYLVSAETDGGDSYGNPTSTLSCTSAAALVEAIYRIPPGAYTGGVGANAMFGPLSFRYA